MTEGEPDATALLETASLRLTAKNLYEKEDYAGALDAYRQALQMLENGPESDRSVVFSNISQTLLQLKEPAQALRAATSAITSDPANIKAHFRKVKSLVELRRPFAACSAARALAFEDGNLSSNPRGNPSQQAFELVLALLKEVQAGGHKADAACPAPPSGPDMKRRPVAGYGALDGVEDLLKEVIGYVDGVALLEFALSNRLAWTDTATPEAIHERATWLCPGRSARWLRMDILQHRPWRLSERWLHESRRLANAMATRNSLAVCGADGCVRLHEPFPSGKCEHIDVAAGCIPYTLCWSPGGEYLAYVCSRGARGRPLAALVLVPNPTSGRQPMVVPLNFGLVPYYLFPSPCGTRVHMPTR